MTNNALQDVMAQKASLVGHYSSALDMLLGQGVQGLWMESPCSQLMGVGEVVYKESSEGLKKVNGGTGA